MPWYANTLSSRYMTFILTICGIGYRLRPSSIMKAESVFKNRILPYFHDKPISSITPADIRAWQNQQIEMGYSNGCLEHIYVLMGTILNYAVSYYNLPSNPCKKAGGMGKHTKSMNFWTLDQYSSFIQHVTDIGAHAALQLLFYSSSDIVEPPKTDNDIRTITMPEAIMQEVKEYTEKQYAKPNNSTKLVPPK